MWELGGARMCQAEIATEKPQGGKKPACKEQGGGRLDSCGQESVGAERERSEQ